MKFSTAVLAMMLVAGPALANDYYMPPEPYPPGPVHIPDAPELPYHYAPRPVAPLGEQFGNVAAVAIKPNGDLLVFNRNPDIMMVEYDPTGTTVKRVFNPNIAINPHAMRIDRHGNIWISDSFLNLVYKLDDNGNVLKVFGVRGENAPWNDKKWNGMFNQPMDIGFANDSDDFYVVQSHGGTSPPADCTFCATYDSPQRRGGHAMPVVRPPAIVGGDPRVMKFDKDGHLLASASLARTDGTLPTIHSVIVAPNGDVWVADRASQRIVVFDKDLHKLRDIQLQNLVCGFYKDAKGQLWISTGNNGLVLKVSWDGKVEGWFGHHGRNRDSNDIGEAHFMAVSPDEKTIWVADTVLAKVVKLVHN